MFIGPLELVIILVVLVLIALPVIVAIVLLPRLLSSLRERGGVPGANMKKCPYCAEFIKQEARVCRYCGRDQPPGAPPAV